MNHIENDILARKQALNASQSFIVQAPAGSGKTELLIQRYLTLLSHVKAPEEILAITFTKKASNEMRARINKALREAAIDAPMNSAHQQTTRNIAKAALAQDKMHQWSLLENPNRMRIQTIDSLCSSLTKQLPLLSQMGASAAISDTPDLLYVEAVKEVLAHLENNDAWADAIKILLMHLDNDVNRVHELLIRLLKKRDQWLNYIHLDVGSDDIRQYLENELFAVVNEFVDHATVLLSSETKTILASLAEYATNHLELSNPNAKLVRARKESSPLLYWIGIAELLLTAEGTWRKQFNIKNGFPAASEFKNKEEKNTADAFKQTALALIGTLNDNEELRKAMAEVALLPPTTYTDNQWQVLNALFAVLKLTAAQLRVFFQQKSQIDFIENTQAALIALGDEAQPTDLALALDYQTKHILLDEFQDTSFTQFKLLEKMTLGWQTYDGRTLFIVGDPMQSIYRFREADVGLFISLFEGGFAHIKLTPLALRRNFRASQKLVNWSNSQFTHIFPKKNHIATGDVSYTESIAAESAYTSSNIIINEFNNSRDHAQAEKIVSDIQQLRKSAPNEKIAILVRARTHLQAIIPTLNKHGIHYQALDIDPLMDKQYIQDILALTKALLHPEDRIAWFSVLRAPWCGLTLSDLATIANLDSRAIIFTQLTQPALLNALSPDGQQRLARILPILQTSITERHRQQLRFWIENTWRLLGGPACLQHASQIEDTKRLFMLFDQLNATNESFNFEKLAKKMAVLFAKPATNDNAVQLMTIHSAKGLEFDTVILPHLEKKSANDDSQLLNWMEYPLKNNKHSLILAPIHATVEDKNPMYQFITRQQKKRADNEVNRLLYVAVTRAKKNLYLYYNVNVNEDEISHASNSFLGKLMPAFKCNAENIHKISSIIDSSHSQPSVNLNLSRLKTSWTNPFHISLQPHPLDRSNKRIGFTLPDYSKKHIGTLAHSILQMFAQNGTQPFLQLSDKQQTAFIQRGLQQLNFPIAKLQHGIERVKKIIENILTDPKGKWILQNHHESACEFAISHHQSGKTEMHIIDRTFIDEDGVRWIIDYKTATLDQEDLTSFLEKEEEKYRHKMLQYADALSNIRNEKIKIGLYFPALPVWREW